MISESDKVRRLDLEIDIDEKLANLKVIYNNYEISYNDISRSGQLDQIACGRGCSYCCKPLIFVYEIDGLYIRLYIDKLRFSNNLVEQEKGEKFKNNIEKWIEKFKDFMQAEKINFDLIIQKCEVIDGKRWEWVRKIWSAYKRHLEKDSMGCPFLTNNECGIYEHRPLVCRSYWSLTVNRCKSFFEEKNFDVQINSPLVQDSIREKFEQEIYQLSISKRKIPLPLVVANPEYYLTYESDVLGLEGIKWKELQ